MIETNELPSNTFFIEVSGSGLPEVDGLFVPSIGAEEGHVVMFAIANH